MLTSLIASHSSESVYGTCAAAPLPIYCAQSWGFSLMAFRIGLFIAVLISIMTCVFRTFTRGATLQVDLTFPLALPLKTFGLRIRNLRTISGPVHHPPLPRSLCNDLLLRLYLVSLSNLSPSSLCSIESYIQDQSSPLRRICVSSAVFKPN